jgi:hypothetical protein
MPKLKVVCKGVTAAGAPCTYSAKNNAGYCGVHAHQSGCAAPRAVNVRRAEAARLLAAAAEARRAEQERLFAEAAAAMPVRGSGAGAGAGAAAAYSPKELNAFHTLGMAPTRNAAAIRRAYHALLVTPNVRAAFTTPAGGNNAAARNRFAKIQAAYAVLQ